MKIRYDYVTNSSSSSFIVAKKGDLTEEQKDKILEFVYKRFLGVERFNEESNEEEVDKYLKDHYIKGEKEEKVKLALKEGKSLYMDEVDFECCAYEYHEIYRDFFRLLEQISGENLDVIDGDMNY